MTKEFKLAYHGITNLTLTLPPVSSDLVASHDEVRLAPAFVDDIAQAPVSPAVAEYAVPIFHFSGEKVPFPSVPFPPWCASLQ